MRVFTADSICDGRAVDYDLISAYDYDLPPELVADVPAATRTVSRLMVGAPQDEAITHHRFGELADLLAPGDLLVFNDIRVVPARIHARKPTGGAVELFVVDVVSPTGADRWESPATVLTLSCMTRASKPVRVGHRLVAGDIVFEVLRIDHGIAEVKVEHQGSAASLLAAVGEIPLPPYIVRRHAELGDDEAQPLDAERYQTVYARRPGAVAAPTAGLHFDEALLAQLDHLGVARAAVTLEVGPGTFRPVTAERLSEHEMHTERYTIGAKAKIMMTSFSATCVNVKCGSPRERLLQTKTIAVQGAAASRISPAI